MTVGEGRVIAIAAVVGFCLLIFVGYWPPGLPSFEELRDGLFFVFVLAGFIAPILLLPRSRKAQYFLLPVLLYVSFTLFGLGMCVWHDRAENPGYWTWGGYSFGSNNQGDNLHARMIDEWALSHLRDGEDVPQWFDLQCMGMPTVGACVTAVHTNPVIRANLWMNGYETRKGDCPFVIKKSVYGVLDCGFVLWVRFWGMFPTIVIIIFFGLFIC